MLCFVCRFKVVQMFGLSFALALQLTLSTRSNTAVRLSTATLFFGLNVFFVGTVWPYFRPIGNCQCKAETHTRITAHAHTKAHDTHSTEENRREQTTRRAHAHRGQSTHQAAHTHARAEDTGRPLGSSFECRASRAAAVAAFVRT